MSQQTEANRHDCTPECLCWEEALTAIDNLVAAHSRASDDARIDVSLKTIRALQGYFFGNR